jgi:hypothetical protein
VTEEVKIALPVRAVGQLVFTNVLDSYCPDGRCLER